MGSPNLILGGFKPVLKKYGIKTHYTVDEANGSEPYEVEAVFPKGTYSALDYTPVKSGYRFAGWSDGTELPYDAEVEYLESTGTQYIDTGIKTGPGYWSIKFVITAAKFGEVTRIAGGNRTNSASGFYIWHNANETRVGATNVGTAVVYYSLDSSNCVEIGKTQQTQASSDNNIWVFAAQGFSEYSAIRLYYFKLWDSTGNTLLRDLIPVRNNGVGYLFDKISGQLFGNQGTGVFLYGGDVPFVNLSSSDQIRYGLSNVYAVWQLPVVVTFDATTNGGEMPSGWVAPDYYGGQAYGTLPVPTKADNVFLGWFTSLGTRVGTSTKSPYNDHTLTARYAVPTYDTSFEVTTTSSYRKAGIYAANSRNTANPTIVDWGDGSTSVVYGNISQLVHTYSSNGTFTVRVNNNINSFALSANNSTWYQTTTNNRYVVKKVTAISSNVNSIPNYAFYYLAAMTSFTMWSAYKGIPQYCFAYCSSLSPVTIPSGFTAINNYAFYYCTGSAFSSITIPASVTAISTNAFAYCYYLSNITFEPGSATLTFYSGSFQRCFYYNTGTLDLSPRKITSIPANCFYYCRYLNGVVWPQGLTSIGQYSFCNCFDMAAATGTLSIPEGVTALSGKYSFGYCRYLTAITLPSTLTSIGNYAFYYCTRLASITSNRATAPTVSAATFGNGSTYYTGRNSYSSGTNKLYVPAGATGYTSSYWGSVLLDSTKCGFTLEEMQ